MKVVLALDCSIKDDQPLTSDLWLINTGTGNLPSGLKIRYRIPSTGDHGAFLLPRDIEVGKEARLADFLTEVPVGEECRVEILA